MTAAQWTAALVAAVKSPQRKKDIALGEVPSWVGLAAMREVGFRFAEPAEVEHAMRALARGAELEAHELQLDVFKQLLVSRSPVDAAIIVVRWPSSSLANSWIAQPSRISLVAPAEQLRVLLSHEFPLGTFLHGSRRLLAVEVNDIADNRDEPNAERALAPVQELLKEWRLRPVFVYDREPSDMKRLMRPYVIAPTSFENLLTADERQSDRNRPTGA
jgi:hypothetical protein